MAAPFKTQVAVVAGILVMTVLLLVYFSMPEPPEDSGRSRVRVAGVPIVSVPQASVTTAPAAPATISRFRQQVEITPDAVQNTADWTAGTLDGKTVLLDNRSGMVWGPKLEMEVLGFSNADLDQAKAGCEAETPPDTWALPTAAEFDIAKVNGLLRADGDARHAWLTYQKVSGLEIPSGRIYVASSNDGQPGRRYAVRCVARSEKAPPDGYLETTNEITLKATMAP